MNGFQIVGLALAGVFTLVSLARAVANRARGGEGRLASVAWAALWIAAGVAIARPDLTSVVARAHGIGRGALGIGRGADVVFYAGLLAMLVGFFVVFTRFRRLEENITTLVRQLAIIEEIIEEAVTAEKKGARPPAQDAEGESAAPLASGSVRPPEDGGPAG